jgi:hypothetical protein
MRPQLVPMRTRMLARRGTLQTATQARALQWALRGVPRATRMMAAVLLPHAWCRGSRPSASTFHGRQPWRSRMLLAQAWLGCTTVAWRRPSAAMHAWTQPRNAAPRISNPPGMPASGPRAGLWRWTHAWTQPTAAHPAAPRLCMRWTSPALFLVPPLPTAVPRRPCGRSSRRCARAPRTHAWHPCMHSRRSTRRRAPCMHARTATLRARARMQRTQRELAITQLGPTVEVDAAFAASFVPGRHPNDTAALAKRAQKKARKEASRAAARCVPSSVWPQGRSRWYYRLTRTRAQGRGARGGAAATAAAAKRGRGQRVWRV